MKKAGYILLTLCLLLAIASMMGGNYMLRVAVTPEENYGKNYETAYKMVYRAYPEMEAWHDSLVEHNLWRDTTICNADGLKLHGIYLQHDSLATGAMMIIHGYCDDAPVMMRYTYCAYQDLGMNVLLPERQNCGLSDGDHITFGWLDHLDMPLWVDVMHSLWPKQNKWIHGLSMGAATCMMMSGEEWADSLKVMGFIEDCGYSSTRELMKYRLKEQFGLPPFPLINCASLICRMKYGWSFTDDAMEQVAKSTKPMLFIHGDKDDYVPSEMAAIVYEQKTVGYKELWMAPGSAHAKSIHEHYNDYVNHIQDFVTKVEMMAQSEAD